VPPLSADRSSPRLLVSVRNRAEARSARAAGTDLIDLKEPRRGSLGMADLSVAALVAADLPDSPLSLALGELTEWKNAVDIPEIPSVIRFLKLGLSQQADNSGWKREWAGLMRSISERSGKSFDWVAVIYADSETARSPAPEVIIDAARTTNCAGVLFDTWSKSAGSLTDHLSTDSLASYIESIHAAGMLAALAGSIRQEHLPELLPLGADIIAARGAVCSGRDRTAEIDAAAVVKFKQLLTIGEDARRSEFPAGIHPSEQGLPDFSPRTFGPPPPN
jgi:uncharacterized protein (UPF0264 family)